MQLSKLLLFMLVACSAIQTLGAPVVRPKCELGEYPDALVDCLPCPSLEGNTEDYLKTFANQHKECPYPPPATWTATTEASSPAASKLSTVSSPTENPAQTLPPWAAVVLVALSLLLLLAGCGIAAALRPAVCRRMLACDSKADASEAAVAPVSEPEARELLVRPKSTTSPQMPIVETQPRVSVV
ncbi:hypothetical protein BOX15_Mlig029935g1 [Macrostomum lignano]|uniref:TNFR-Cys domain-containing protein n=1 Tax=Macrostomum lignano TaxID=282301 RepID=A0A267E136_9PLAT|nr:hypothetical protein BOX15_Mlig029935g1 [Macrostomum lignano]